MKIDKSSPQYLLSLLFLLIYLILFSNYLSATEYNFESYAKESGCKSIPFSSEKRSCDSAQREKNKACNVSLECDVAKAEKLKIKYNKAKNDLKGAAGPMIQDLEKKTAALQTELKALNKIGESGMSRAEDCIDRRKDVQKVFDKIPYLLERARDEALRKRKSLTNSLNKAQAERTETKKKMEAAAKGTDSGKKSSTKRVWHDAIKAVKSIGAKFKLFDRNNGRIIRKSVAKLIAHYKNEEEKHDGYIDQAKNRMNSCKKLSKFKF
ncbi:hypothetical protein MNBD_GAMMA12-2890 [hydrothermal vent metagenome]|uniref:Uncharacterized protein n=1 Tax=hydrothermal vent metagenome TaxID=652676 RepID=A0A3B0Y0I1_9ZZZZ